MENTRFKIHFEHNFIRGEWEIYIIAYDQFHKRSSVAKLDMVFEPLEQYMKAEPCLKISDDYAPAMMDAFRLALKEQTSTDDATIKGTLAATLYHLEDMRKLVFEVKK